MYLLKMRTFCCLSKSVMLNSPNMTEDIVTCFIPCVFKSPLINFAIYPPTKCDLANP
uniref:Uncharacterized protein n=1 Tax=Spermophilus dauricus TaxID=99837 RepID=A0A8C9PPE5_SPEDA